jgi:hypothetical protein
VAEFYPEELKAAFEAGKIPAHDDSISRLDGPLRALARQYRSRKVAHEQDLKRQPSCAPSIQKLPKSPIERVKATRRRPRRIRNSPSRSTGEQSRARANTNRRHNQRADDPGFADEDHLNQNPCNPNEN